MSRYKNQSVVCVLMDVSFPLFLQLFFASYSTMLSLIVSMFCNNTFLFLESGLGIIARGVSTNRVSELTSIRRPRVILPVHILLTFAIDLLCNDFILPGHGIPLQWTYSL